MTESSIDPGVVTQAELQNPEVDPSVELKKRVYRGFALAVAFGLSLAVFYIGGRVWAAHRQAPEPRIIKLLPDTVPAATPITTASTTSTQAAPEVIPSEPVKTVPEPERAAPPPPQQQTVAAPVKTVPEPSQLVETRLPADWKVIEPAAGQTYLQVAALGRHPAEKYIPELTAKGLHPLVAAGPSDGLFRVLIGPFDDHKALQKAQQDLVAVGIEPFARTY